MHRALRILEVVEMICAQIPLRGDPTPFPDLARLARTSQSFLEPALNALWRHQETIVNLLKVMPLGLWAIEEDREAESRIRDFDVTLLRPAIPSDWHRFLFYAQRVRSFNLWEDCKTPEAYETLTRHFPQQSIFPRLEELKWYPVTSSYLGYVRLFLTPTLTCLDLKMESISDLGILATLALICPHLTSVRLGGTPDAAVPLISTFIRELHHLESLTVHCIDAGPAALVENLASAWPRIEILQLTSHSSCRLPPRVTLEGIYAFAKSCPNLEDLAIAFDAGFMPKIHINGKRRVVQLRLESIDVLHSLILNPLPATFLPSPTIVFCARKLDQLLMHRALHILEVVEMICAQIPLQADQRSPDLARLARTSQLFLDPALDILWRYQETIVNLLKVMPVDLWDIQEDREDSDESAIRNLDVTLLRPVAPSDWDRWLLYARRVRSFTLLEDFKTPEAYETLALHFPPQSIFPRLEKLDWFPVKTSYFGYVRPFITPTITNLHLTIESFSDLGILATAALTCPRLTEVRLGCISDAGLGLVSEFVCALHHLESLVVGGLDEAAFFHIARLPTLHYLWLLDSPMLGSTTVNTARILLSKSLYSDAVPIPRCRMPASYSVGGDTLEPLLVFRNLVVLHLFHSAGFHLDDAMIGKMASAWPRIEILEFTSHSSCRLPPRVTLEGLYAFATHCPSLESLSIAFDATIIPKTKINGKRRVVQDRLEFIDVAHSPIRKRRPVAKFLGAIFPGLHMIRTSYDQFPKIEDAETVARDELWTDVQDYLQ
ncbi:hypothetical protein C8R46DRAFT_1276117 [Mycena filopes]|nr:hypothetical protein C8R46DRAFT_1276117 [Mycena filopes]